MRQLESLTRLTQARAKVELRSVCIKRDALDVIEIMKASMVDYCDNDNLTSMLDLTTTGGSSSKSSMIKQFVSILQRVSDEKRSDLFNFDEIRVLFEKSYLKIKNINTTGDLINLLNNANYLLKRGPKLYKLASSNF